MTDFYSRVPKDFAANLRYRLSLRERAQDDTDFRQAMLTACKLDFLFFLNAWCWVYEPRPRFSRDGKLLPKKMPFITWENQDPVFRQLRDNLGFRDISVIKSRGEGMSWGVVDLAVHDWLFDAGSKIGLVSRSEDEADDPDNADSLLWKFQYTLDTLPSWMGGIRDIDYARNVSKHSFFNKRNGAQVNADAATGAVFRGGRLKWAAKDEFAFFKPGEDKQAQASSQGATDSRLYISTVNGTDNQFYLLNHEANPSLLKIEMDWRQNPTKNRGLYEFRLGRPVAISKDNPLPTVKNPYRPDGPNGEAYVYDPPNAATLKLFKDLRERGYKLEGRQRSPWYDHECIRSGATPASIARELDRDWGGSMARIFMPDFFVSANATVRKPVVRGRLTYHPETLEPEFESDPGGNLLLWMPLDNQKKPPRRDYSIGCDISAGQGGTFGSNSAASILDHTTFEQVGELVTATTEPTDFADLCIALAKWLWDCQLGWEHNGPGTAFTKRVITQGYGNVFKREILHKQSKKRTSDYGWWTGPKTKEVMFADLSNYVKRGEYVMRSRALVDECGQYVRISPTGQIGHVKTSRSKAMRDEDPASAGETHSDRVIAAGIALQMFKRKVRHWEKPESSGGIVVDPNNPPPNTLAARMKFYGEQDREKAEGLEWDARSNWDMAGLGSLAL